MNHAAWLRRSLAWHWRSHLALLGVAALSSAILAAALLAGDALNRDLERIALERVGRFRSAVELRGRFVDAGLAGRLAASGGGNVAPVLRLPTALLGKQEDGSDLLAQAEALGVDHRFTARPPGKGEMLHGPGVHGFDAYSSSRHAALRFEKPPAFPLEMPLGDRTSGRTVRLPVQPGRFLARDEGGRFSLSASQIPPPKVFVDRDWLAEAAGVPGRANLLLSDAEPAALERALREGLLPADLGLSTTDAGGVRLLHAGRVYLDEAHVRVLSGLRPSPVLALHHLADSFSAGEGTGERRTPYGFVSALGPTADARLGVVPEGMADDEVVVNEWLAGKLGLSPGDRMTMSWRRFEPGGTFVADSAAFRVRAIIPMAAAEMERERLPRFPGLSDVERCADWDVGLPMDQAQLADPANEAYWKAHGAAPKAFVTLEAGRRMLGTLFGSAMTARFPPEADPATITAGLRQADPAALGLVVRPIRQEALQAARGAMDFRLLFAGMSLVLVLAALLLVMLLAAGGVARRVDEAGALAACGLSARRITGLFLAESALPLLAGSAMGVGVGLGGARLLVRALDRYWLDAVAGLHITFSAGPGTCALAGVLAFTLALLAVLAGLRRGLRAPVRVLLAGPEETEGEGRPGRDLALGLACVAASVLVLLLSRGAAGAFFGGGFLLMVGLLFLARWLIARLGRGRLAAGPVSAGLLNAARSRGRGLPVMVLLAGGSFLSVGILSMKHDPAAGSDKPWSGSGGFDIMVEAGAPLAAGQARTMIRQALDGEPPLLAFRVHEGEEAGCLNLNRALRPRLLGVRPEEAAAAGAFERAAPSAWSRLGRSLPDGTLPVLAGDLTTLEYGLQARAGEKDGTVYEYRGEDGATWRLRLVGALPVRTGVLQGSLVVDGATLARMYPSEPAEGLWLVGGLQGDRRKQDLLSNRFGSVGGSVIRTTARLHELGRVESAYLDMFLVLGGLGVALGAAGLGLVVLSGAAGRLRELAVLRAMGLGPGRVFAYLAAEHLALLLAGLVAGVLPALVAVQPAARSLRQDMPFEAMAWCVGLMAASGLAATLAAAWRAAGRPVGPALGGG